jgi:hypothetical protein
MMMTLKFLNNSQSKTASEKLVTYIKIKIDLNSKESLYFSIPGLCI